ncbi:MAG: hypothetical protein KGY45_01960, partial [Hadesarchaea archaeon]|nr:hypothetical protein [Hadesarchaea archaeon]
GNIGEDSSEAEIAETVQNIELGTARDLENKANEMADEGKGESIQSIVEEAQARINSATNAAVDNDGLERARKASQKHLAVLENVYEKVPDVAKPAISIAMEQSSRHLGILENVKSQVPAIGEISQQVRETIRNKVQEMTENFKQANEKLQNQLEGVEEGSSEMDEIVEEYDNKAENQENGDEGEQYTPNIP